MGIGLYITGTLIPYLEIVRHAGTIFDRVMNGPSLGFVEIANGVGVLLAMGLAISGGKKMRASAKAEIAALDDLIGKPS